MKRMLCLLAALLMATTAMAESAPMREMTTQEIVEDMGIGINLGNTYEACGDWILQWAPYMPESFETAWGSPVITQEMIQGYKRAGFGVLRIPVAWSNMMDENYLISPAYIAAVQEVVDWALAADLYVILNIHYDGGWFADFPTKREACMTKYVTIWGQLCDAFGQYGDKLIFESLNEEGGWQELWNPWSNDTSRKKESFDLLNDINQRFVNVVRSSGGNNALRHLLIAGYNTNIAHTCDPLFRMPQDPAGRCAVSVHYYDPSTFTILSEDADWGKSQYSWGTAEDLRVLAQNMEQMRTTFVDQGIPVIIGEYGTGKVNKDPASVNLYLISVCQAARERGMCPILWDVTGLHYDRDACTMVDPALMEGLLQAGEK